MVTPLGYLFFGFCIFMLSFTTTPKYEFIKWIEFIVGILLVVIGAIRLDRSNPKKVRQGNRVSMSDIRKMKKGGIVYNNGHEYEHFVAAWLATKGYSNVIVTPKSGDYGADIIATDPNGNKTAIQCKLYSQPVGYKAVEEVLGGMHYYNCTSAMVITNSTYTAQAIRAAKKMGVKLIQEFR